MWDVDGILSFTSEALVVALNARFGTAYSVMTQDFFPGTLRIDRLPDVHGSWIAGEMSRPEFALSYAPDFRAIDTLRDASEAGFECLVATERPPALQEATEAWLHSWGAPPVPVHAVGHGNKPAFMAEQFAEGHYPAILVDDNPVTWMTIARPGVQVWSPERPYTLSARARDHVRLYASYPAVRYWLGLGPQP